MKCVEMNWMVILTGPFASGKTSIVRLLAQLTRNTLHEFAMNTGVDTTELLGGFEQVDFTRYRKQLIERVSLLMQTVANQMVPFRKDSTPALQELYEMWNTFQLRAKFTQK